MSLPIDLTSEDPDDMVIVVASSATSESVSPFVHLGASNSSSTTSPRVDHHGPQPVLSSGEAAAIRNIGGSSTEASVHVATKKTITRKRPRPEEAEKSCRCDDVVNTCIICTDPFTRSGPHRVIALRCGHLYGKSCIREWLGYKSVCPQCKSKVSSTKTFN